MLFYLKNSNQHSEKKNIFKQYQSMSFFKAIVIQHEL